MQKLNAVASMMVLTGSTEQDVIDRVIEFRKEFRDKPPLAQRHTQTCKQSTRHTAVFEKTGKYVVLGMLWLINWNRKKMYSDAYSMDIVDGQKTIVCKLKNNPMGITSIGYPTDELRISLIGLSRCRLMM